MMKALFEQHLEEKYFVKAANEKEQMFNEAIRYSLLAGGKRMRPILFLTTLEILGKDPKAYLSVASAIEMIHTYSLIHDDLPSMDNDNFRRGKLTSHKKYGEAIALLAGDALLNKAYELLISFAMEGKAQGQAAMEIAKAASHHGMIGGQVADISSHALSTSKEDLTYIIENKTGKLLRASVIAAALISEVSQPVLEKLDKVAYNIGFSFQIIDDILDETGSVMELGKNPGQDRKLNKSTYVSMHGLDQAKKDAEAMIEEARKILVALSDQYELSYFMEILDQLANRNN